MSADRLQFGKRIELTGKKGVLRIVGSVDEIVGDTKKPISAESLDDLGAVVMKAFPNEFEGSEGKVAEEELLEPVRKRYPKEQPDEICDRVMPALMAQGYSAKEISEQLLARNSRVKLALKLADLSRTEIDGLIHRLEDSILSFWPQR